VATYQYRIYVDGSFINGSTGYGAVVLKNGEVIDELSGAVDASEADGTRQVAGELAAVKEALNWCLAHAVNKVSIYYDYLGIEKWASGQWKTNQPLTKEYARFVRECPIKIHWHKVDSHTGDRWNDRADALAKQGAGTRRAGGGKSAGGDRAGGASSERESGGREPAAREGDLVSELIKRTDNWIEFLMVRGVDARLDRVFNEQFARVYIRQKDESVGTFDLYNTKKKRFSPYVHNFRDNALKLRIETLWTEFQTSLR
jgi:ribonuclease HI